MGYGGHALDMISKLSQNRDLRKANRSIIKKAHEAHLKLSKNHKPLEIKKINKTKEELEIIKTEIKTKIKKQRRTEIIISIAVTFIVLSAFFFFLFLVKKKFNMP